jgi:7-cyano-7-deazaguanine synthase
MGNNDTVVVVLSGGQDSVTCLGLAIKKYVNVFAIGFEYGQKHSVELEQAALICKDWDIPFVVHQIPSLSELADSALTTNGDVDAKHHRDSSLPASFVPNRNALFLTIAHAYAQKVGANYLMTGVCQTDYSGYPDCRLGFISSLQETLNRGYNTAISILTPLMELTKAETFKLAQDVGFLNTVIMYSHTCYNGDRETLNEWGAGCGECGACKLRAKGYAEYLEKFCA